MERVFRALLALAILGAALSASAGINTLTGVGPDGGRVIKLVFHPTSADTLFVLTGTGAYRSVNSGASWQRVNTYTYVSGSTDLEIDPANPARVYLTGSIPLVSNDGGVTFAALTGLPTQDVRHVEISADGAVTYIASSDRVYRSSDHGVTWSERGRLITGASDPIGTFILDPADPNTLYALARTSSTTTGLFLSENGGTSWELVDNRDFQDGINSLAVSANPRRVWITRLSNVYVSSDQGRHSSPVSFNQAASSIAVDPANADKLYVGGSLYGYGYQSNDAGLHWTRFTDSLLDAAQGIYPHPRRPGEIYVAGGSDFWRTTDGGATWSRRHTGFSSTTISSFSANATRGRVYFNSSLGGVHYLQGGTSVTSEVNDAALRQQIREFPQFAYAYSIHAQEGTPGRLYVALLNDLLRSPDGGNTWQRLPFPTLGNLNLNSITSSPGAPDVLFAAGFGTGVQRSTDGGDHWSDASAGLPATAGLYVVAAAASDKSFVYGAPYVVNPAIGEPPFGHGVYRWNDVAQHWDAANSGMEEARVTDLQVHAADPRVAFAVTNTGLMKTTTGGSSWTALAWDSTTLDVLRARVALDPVDPRIVYASSNAHIVRSVTGGTSWETLADSPFSREATALIADPTAAGTLIVGTSAEGVFQITVAPDLAVQMKAPTTLPSGTALSYELTALNLGPFHATGVQVTAQLPAGVTDISAEPASACTVVTSTVNCALDVLRAGFSSSITLHAKAASAGTFPVTARITGAQEDSVATNNNVSGSTTVQVQSDLSVSATGSATAQAGSAVTYTVNVTNAGPNTASSTQLSYQLASGLSNASATTTRGVCTSSSSQLICALGNLGSNESATITINATAATAGKQDSVATVSTDSTDTILANNSAANSTTVSAAPSSGGGGTGGGGSTGGGTGGGSTGGTGSTSTSSGGGGGGGGALSPDLLLVLALFALGHVARRIARKAGAPLLL